MQILMFVLQDDAPDADRSDDIDGWVAEADKGNRRVVGGPLDPVDEAVTIRVRNGSTERTSGSKQDATTSILGLTCWSVLHGRSRRPRGAPPDGPQGAHRAARLDGLIHASRGSAANSSSNGPRHRVSTSR